MEPLVSICMSTYKHAAFIGKAIEGVLMQKTSFPIQLVIGEDRSNDGTREICEKYQRENQSIIHLLPSDKNYGQNINLARILEACTGKYVAVCEGDDFWTDPYKLQKQVDFLEKHPEFVMCFHRMNSVDQNDVLIEKAEPTEKVVYYKGIELFHVFTGTPTLLFRNCLPALPAEFYKVKSTDAFLVGMLTGYGEGADLGFVGASYRKHIGGLYNQLNPLGRFKQSIHTRKMMKRSAFFTEAQKREIKKELVKRESLYVKYFLKKKQLGNCMRILSFYLSAR